MRSLFGKFARIYMVGIGGAGMEGLARILRQMGCHVSGADQMASPAVDRLRQDGFEVYGAHRAEQVSGADLVVYSAAVPENNAELCAARRLGVAVVKRAVLLGELTRSRFAVGVAGSHGKTTTAAMLAAICRRAGLEPGTAVGGCVEGRVEAGWGKGDIFVVEADEYDRSFHQLYPRLALVTGIDAEHLDCYRDLADVQRAFEYYLDRLPFYGQGVLAGDDDGVQTLLDRRRKNWITYGIGCDNDCCAEAVELGEWSSRFAVLAGGERLGQVELQVPGEYNVQNALGAIAAARVLGVDFVCISSALQAFVGVGRRFERKGEVGGVVVVDDYAHHPAEIVAVLEAARRSGRRLVAAFQPHLYTRTRALLEEFVQALQGADQVALTAIYGAREDAAEIEADEIVRRMQQEGFAAVQYIPELADLAAHLAATCREGDMILTMGAGNIDQVADDLLLVLSN